MPTVDPPPRAIPIELRPFTRGDIPTLLRWIESPTLLQQWAGPALTFPLGAARVEHLLADAHAPEPGRLVFKAIATPVATMVGSIELANISRQNRSATVSRVLVGPPDLRGRGIGTAMVRAVVRIAFEDLGLHRLGLAIFDWNRPAIAAYERVGFRRDGVVRDVLRVGDGYWSNRLMSLLDHEWQDRTPRPDELPPPNER